MSSSAASETQFASLGPMLLARKGTAKPAMRAQLTTSDRTAQLGDDFDDLADSQSDLGWNDMGENDQVVPLPVANNRPHIMPDAPVKARRSAVSQGKRAAFTLRLDAERHLKMRLASTMQDMSAQALVTEALDRFLDAIPELDAIAAQVNGKKNTA
ncbi:hypothetical protein [Aurantiacibacter sp. D1-12]|uniref:hypothetical protein n=1 Tax=Aurantiacibacter sp. D1-12 TaxID=2993658 RepID=UPI00237CB70B|nr:hypothetical protein [Aurantiacibacter sp. D1-12]MDE1467091.1 hypothetical protein [Aurantiacibacter sp. D1-12]